LRRISSTEAVEVFGCVFDGDEVDEDASRAWREELRQERLASAQPGAVSIDQSMYPATRPDWSASARRLYGTVLADGDVARVKGSGAALAVAPNPWIDGCPYTESLVNERAGVVIRSYLDPTTGRCLYTEVSEVDGARSFDSTPDWWLTCAMPV
jgi:hypothetical protein